MKNQTERRASERNYYVDGNTVRRMEAVPDYRRERREREEREREEQLRRRKRQVRRNQERQLRMSKRYVVFLPMSAVSSRHFPAMCMQSKTIRYMSIYIFPTKPN